jgi:hypothetical protein
MGVLDDAIREHLDLKRKHGAAEEELQRQEEEALGPARRNTSQEQEAPADGDAATVAAEVEEGEITPEADAAELAESEVPDPSEEQQQAEAADAAPALVEPPADQEESPSAPEGEDTALFDGERERPAAVPMGDTPDRGFAPVDEPGPAPPQHAAVEPFDEPDEPDHHDEPDEPDPHGTQEFDPFAEEDEVEPEQPAEAAEGEEGEGDVLEDTPDFLQETPEHDRLWFEQKPPRDFDFD